MTGGFPVPPGGFPVYGGRTMGPLGGLDLGGWVCGGLYLGGFGSVGWQVPQERLGGVREMRRVRSKRMAEILVESMVSLRSLES